MTSGSDVCTDSGGVANEGGPGWIADVDVRGRALKGK